MMVFVNETGNARERYTWGGKIQSKIWACTFKFSFRHSSVDVCMTVEYTSLEVKRKSAGKKKKLYILNKKNVVEEK